MTLSELKALIESKSGDDGLTLSADDDDLPAELAGLLETMPDGAITLMLAEDGLDLDGSSLTITGAVSADWDVTGLTASLAVGAVAITIDETEAGMTAGCVLDATLTLGSATPPVSVTYDDGPWLVALTGTLDAVRPIDLLRLGPSNGEPMPIPEDLDLLGEVLSVLPDDFEIAFHPAKEDEATEWKFGMRAPATRWEIAPPTLVFQGIEFRAALSTEETPVMTVAGRLTVDAVALLVEIDLSTEDEWPVTLRPATGTAFPGLAALAGWNGGATLAGAATDGVATLDLDRSAFDLAIKAVTLAVEWRKRSIASFKIASALTVAELPLDVVLSLPDLAITGALKDKARVKVKAMVAAAGLPDAGVPDALAVDAVAFSAKPRKGSYALEAGVTGVWAAGPVALESVAFALTYGPQENPDEETKGEETEGEEAEEEKPAADDGDGKPGGEDDGKGEDGKEEGEKEAKGGITAGITCRLKLGNDLTLALEGGYAGAETGWRFSGAQTPQSRLSIGSLLAALGREFGVSDLPAPLKDLALTRLSLCYETGDGTFAFACDGGFTVADKAVDMSVSIRIARGGPKAGSKGYAATVGGALTIDGFLFAITFDRDSDSDLLVALFRHDETRTVDLGRLVAGVSPSLGALVPGGIAVDLEEAKFLYWSDGKTKRFAFGLGMDVVVDLTRLPLVGDRLPADETLAIDNLQVLYASAAVGAEETGRIAALLPEEATGLPEDGLSKGVGISADIRFAGTSLALLLPVGDGPASEAAKPEEDEEAGEEAPSDGTRWFSIQRQFGIFQFNRIGVGFADNVLSLSLDADIALGPLTLSLDGLSAGSPLDAFDPVFDLHGLGVDFQKDPLAISGALIKLRRSELAAGVDFQFDGAFSLRFKQFGLAGIGSYARMKSGDASLFLFVQVLAPLGGVPPIFIDGLMAGGGFNRELAIPGIDEVQSFPFLLLGRPPTPGSEAETFTPMDVLHVLEGKKAVGDNVKPRKWVVPRMGSLWLAAGLHFTAFGIIKTRALLIVQPTGDFTIALLGIASMQLPVPAEGVPTYAFLELQLRAVFQPTLGVIEASAVLTSASYLLTRECRLTGGFAFSLWFPPSPHAGDFVVTVGGYHPAFKVPAHYPKVPRVGFNWSVSDCVTVKGEAYFALTPSCIMGGCALEALFSDGDLRAWFIARADFLVSWRPFYFLAEIEISVGVSYRLNLLFCHKTLSVSVGAALTLWGPPTGGKVRVDIVVVSFTVRFGADYGSGASEPLDWDGFSAMLPEPDAICVIAPGAELNRTVDDTASSSRKRWVVQPRGFSFTTQSAIPASRLVCDGPGGTAPRTHAAGAGIDIRPMNRTGVDSTHRVRIARDTVDGPEVDLDGWRFEPRTQPVPKALWGEPPSPFTHIPDRPTADILPDTPTGFQVTTPSPVRGAMAGPAPRHRLMRDYISPPGQAPLRPGTAAATAYRPVRDNVTIGQIAAAAGDTAHAARQSILGALGAAAVYRGRCDRLEGLAGRAGSLFTYAPLKQD
ncbi:hypothetical protein J2847_003348 [Azospirillum agricola]|uniref:DUF6603 domain-containing protein n=1 Tax=Azospirillum agricola TaxID=1720247 RepID=UPI001AE3B325|nr:DUF6603 domain-containing protein [Azospirillum agricola]MBP2230045.1 hypothetical protein [Azospirillum agricola]